MQLSEETFAQIGLPAADFGGAGGEGEGAAPPEPPPPPPPGACFTRRRLDVKGKGWRTTYLCGPEHVAAARAALAGDGAAAALPRADSGGGSVAKERHQAAAPAGGERAPPAPRGWPAPAEWPPAAHEDEPALLPALAPPAAKNPPHPPSPRPRPSDSDAEGALGNVAMGSLGGALVATRFSRRFCSKPSDRLTAAPLPGTAVFSVASYAFWYAFCGRGRAAMMQGGAETASLVEGMDSVWPFRAAGLASFACLCLALSIRAALPRRSRATLDARPAFLAFVALMHAGVILVSVPVGAWSETIPRLN